MTRFEGVFFQKFVKMSKNVQKRLKKKVLKKKNFQFFEKLSSVRVLLLRGF